MKTRLLLFLLFIFAAGLRAAESPRTYQVTGAVTALSDTMITVQKGEEKFEITRSPATKVDGTLAVGNRVTVHYRMSAESVNVKTSPSTEKADKAARKASDKAEKKVSK